MINYNQYLLTPEWAALAQETKRLAGFGCQVCNAGGELHAHHRTYERLGHELHSDLVCLCDSCHALFHGKQGAAAPAGWALVQSLAAEVAESRRANGGGR